MSLTLHSVPGNYRSSTIQSLASHVNIELKFNEMGWDELKSKENL